MHLPLWLLLPFLPVTFWPVTLPILIVLIVLAVRSRGRRRWFAIAGAAIMAALPLSGFAFLMVVGAVGEGERQAKYASTHSVLEQETTLDGFTLPAGTEMAWTSPSHTAWTTATLPRPIDFHGLPVRGITNSRPDWLLELAEPRRIAGWPCRTDLVYVTAEGDLLSCSLSETMTWKGWTLPPQTHISLRQAEGAVDVSTVPHAEAVEGQEIGQSFPTAVTLNDDGSPARTYFSRDTPFLVASTPLWGIVTWQYDPATRGQGRNRPAIAVEGRTGAAAPASPGELEGEPVVVHLPDGTVERRAAAGR